MQMPWLTRKAVDLVITTLDQIQDKTFIQVFETTSYSSLMPWQMGVFCQIIKEALSRRVCPRGATCLKQLCCRRSRARWQDRCDKDVLSSYILKWWRKEIVSSTILSKMTKTYAFWKGITVLGQPLAVKKGSLFFRHSLREGIGNWLGNVFQNIYEFFKNCVMRSLYKDQVKVDIAAQFNRTLI